MPGKGEEGGRSCCLPDGRRAAATGQPVGPVNPNPDADNAERSELICASSRSVGACRFRLLLAAIPSSGFSTSRLESPRSCRRAGIERRSQRLEGAAASEATMQR
jgi:hypothetical protein